MPPVPPWRAPRLRGARARSRWPSDADFVRSDFVSQVRQVTEELLVVHAHVPRGGEANPGLELPGHVLRRIARQQPAEAALEALGDFAVAAVVRGDAAAGRAEAVGVAIFHGMPGK